MTGESSISIALRNNSLGIKTMDNFERGKRVSAGMLLSKFINKIANELSEEVVFDEDGREVPITNAEHLAREIWKKSRDHVDEESENGKLKRKLVRGDFRYVQMLWDRLEGKTATADNTAGPKKQPKASKVDELVGRRLKNLAEED